MADQNTLPRHVGVIMDGNRRWAQQHGVSTARGHKAGFEALFALLPTIHNLGIPYISIYAFSAENWLRSASEVRSLMRLVEWVVSHKLQVLKEQGIRICLLGSRAGLPAKVLTAIERAEAETKDNRAITLGVCFNYGGHQEIVDATKQLMTAGVPADDVTPDVFAQYLYQPDIPAVDLLIRTSGENRLSNFMLWRAAYAELYFTEVLWPDFGDNDLNAALASYSARKRRFGA